jgi:hypothetical protein
MRRKYFATALGSLHEAVGAIDLAAAIDAVDPHEAVVVQALGERLRRMLVALMR